MMVMVPLHWSGPEPAAVFATAAPSVTLSLNARLARGTALLPSAAARPGVWQQQVHVVSPCCPRTPAVPGRAHRAGVCAAARASRAFFSALCVYATVRPLARSVCLAWSAWSVCLAWNAWPDHSCIELDRPGESIGRVPVHRGVHCHGSFAIGPLEQVKLGDLRRGRQRVATTTLHWPRLLHCLLPFLPNAGRIVLCGAQVSCDGVSDGRTDSRTPGQRQ